MFSLQTFKKSIWPFKQFETNMTSKSHLLSTASNLNLTWAFIIVRSQRRRGDRTAAAYNGR